MSCKELQMEQCNVVPCSGAMVCSTGWGVGLARRMPQLMMHREIESEQVEGPPSLAAIEFLHHHEAT